MDSEEGAGLVREKRKGETYPVEDPAAGDVASVLGLGSAELVVLGLGSATVAGATVVEDEDDSEEAAGAADEEPELEPALEPPAAAWHPLPTGAAKALGLLFTTRLGPGSGSCTSLLPTVVHWFPILAKKIGGRSEKAVSRGPRAFRLELPPAIVTLAQFMYISRFPSLLNQLQAKSAAPDAASDGIVKSKLPLVMTGQSPSMDPIVVKVFPLSYDRENWQLPPACGAPPTIVALYFCPGVKVAVEAPSEVPRRL